MSRRSLMVAAAAVLLGSRSREASAAESAAADEQRRLGCYGAVSAPRPSEPVRRSRVEIVNGFRQVKDPCPVFDGRTWHLFGSAWINGTDECSILHAHADMIEGPYVQTETVVLAGVSGPQVAAPGVIHDGTTFHLFVQTAFSEFGGTIEHLVSVDGSRFDRVDTALTSDATAGEACIYDPQPAMINGALYLTFAAATTLGQPELHACRSVSGTWDGPWQRLGPILRQTDVPFQNKVGCRGYEWGLEGPQLLELANGDVLLIGVCFLALGQVGTRQRIFMAIAEQPLGPYRVLGTMLDTVPDSWESAENGHPGAVVVDDRLIVIYQARRGAGTVWSCGLAEFVPPTFR